MAIEYVDVLVPPRFEPSGVVKPVIEAINDGDWLGVMNLWIVRPGPALLYQERSPGGWAPGKFDGSVGGYYRAGESGLDCLREVEEELGWRCPPENISLIGRHLSVGVDSSGRERRLVVTVFMTYDDLPLSRFTLDPKEVPAIYEIPVDDVIEAFENPQKRFRAYGLTCDGRPVERVARVDDFSYVFGGYHLKVAHIARKFAHGERTFYY
jgi:8-oxo-dGTP pyrophosphatase MutT (NUDIX family)